MDRESTIATVRIICEWCDHKMGAATLPYMGKTDRLAEVLCDGCVKSMRRSSQEFAQRRAA